MDEKNKRRVSFNIAGMELSLVTDEPESTIENIVTTMNSAMNALINSNAKRSKLDAAVLCALDFCADKLTAEKKVRNLEAQIALYDASMKRLKDENAALKKKSGEPEEKKEEQEPESPDGQIKIKDSDIASKIDTIEKLLKKNK